MALIHFHANDILCSEGMQREKMIPHHGEVSCYDHSFAVAHMSVRIAQRFSKKADMRSLIRGALLHDYYLYDWHAINKNHRLHGFSHARAALFNAERDFALSNKERDIIVKHMFPLNVKPPRYRETVIVTLSDKVCAIQEITLNALQKLGIGKRENAAY